MSENNKVRRVSEESDKSVNEVGLEDVPPASSKQLCWQETLIQLFATQQQQLAELTRQTKMATATCQSPTPSVSGEVFNAQATMYGNVHASSFKLTSFDPDKSAYSIEEWLDDATKLKEELKISDYLMIVKASEALKNRGYRYCCDWRPLNRTWKNLCDDLITAFPDKETPGARAYKASTLRSRDCESLCDYGTQKLRSISRFHNSLPWEKVLSMVEFGLDHTEARSALRIQNPDCDRELLKLLSEFDARRAGPSRLFKPVEMPRSRVEHNDKRQREPKDSVMPDRPNKVFKGVCFKCGRPGHQQAACYERSKDESVKEPKDKSGSTNIPSCTHCKMIGHTEANCWYKNGKPKKAFVIKK